MASQVEDFRKKRDALFNDMTLERATKLWRERGLPNPVRLDVPLAAAHKESLQWLYATDEMLKESVQWLTDRGYDTTMQGVPPLTPEKRDKDRESLGLGKLLQS